MWHATMTVIHDIQTGSWISRLSWGALVLALSFSLGSLGGLSIHLIKTKWTGTPPLTEPSGSDLKSLTTRSSNSVPTLKPSDETWTIKKSELERSNTKAIDGKP